MRRWISSSTVCFRTESRFLDSLDLLGLQTPNVLFHFKRHTIPNRERLVSGHVKRSPINQDLLTVVSSDKTITFLFAVSIDNAFFQSSTLLKRDSAFNNTLEQPLPGKNLQNGYAQQSNSVPGSRPDPQPIQERRETKARFPCTVAPHEAGLTSRSFAGGVWLKPHHD